MKKYVSFSLLVLSMVFLIGFAVSAQETVVWWYENATPAQEKAFEKDVVEPFNQAYPEYNLKVSYHPKLAEVLRTAILADAGPDIVMANGSSVALSYINEGSLEPLEKYADKYGWNERFIPVMLKNGTFEGTLYSIPKTYETMIMMYNKTLFEEKGWEIPKNRKEFEELAKVTMDEGIQPVVGGNAAFRDCIEQPVGIFLNSYAGPKNIYRALIGEKSWNDPVFVDAIKLLKTYWDKGYYGKNYFSLSSQESVGVMAMGRAAMMFTGSWAFQWMDDYFGDTQYEWDWAPIPMFGDHDNYPSYDLGVGTSLAINSNSQVKDGAAAVIEFLTGNQEVITNLNRDWPGEWNIPVTTISAEDFGNKVDPRYASQIASVADAAKTGNYGYTLWTFWPPETRRYMIEGIEQVVKGSLTPEEYMTKANELFQREMEEGLVPPIPERNL